MNFEACVRYFNNFGLANVYIRITYKRKVGYFKTRYTVTKNQVNGNIIKDLKLLAELLPMIQDWSNKLNHIQFRDVNDILDYLKNGDVISFTKYAERFIRRMINEGRENPAANYRTALRSLQRFYKTENIDFSDITSQRINMWIKSLEHTSVAKSGYVAHVKKMFNEGLLEYNDYDNGVIRIKNDPFRAVKIPKVTNGSKKRAIPPEIIAKIFSYSGEYTKPITGPLSKDVAELIFCLAGINAADLYFMDKSCLVDRKLCYYRKKTFIKRDDSAYMEITIPERLLPLIGKYKGKNRLFSFSEMYSHQDSFVKYVNEGLSDICSSLGIDKVTTYTFRHSWATIAQNNCGASTELVGFCLNHASAHKVTEGYIKKDFSKVDVLNSKVIKTLLTSQPGGSKKIQ
jgi:integrase